MDSMQRVLSYFREICSIPRRSGDESNVAQYLIETGKRLGLGVDQDSCGNVVLRKTISQATPPTILQAHMDMVWESTGTPYQKGVSLRETDECLHAVGSTLGADNGIGMALILALMEDDTVQNLSLIHIYRQRAGGRRERRRPRQGAGSHHGAQERQARCCVHRLHRGSRTVSYTHLDVYKRQTTCLHIPTGNSTSRSPATRSPSLRC